MTPNATFFLAQKQYETAKTALYFDFVNGYTILQAQHKRNFYHNATFSLNATIIYKTNLVAKHIVLHLLTIHAS